MSRPRLAALALVVSMLAGSGCGGSASSPKSLTRSDLIARADAICRRVNAKLTGTRIRSKRTFVELAVYEHAAVTEMRKLIPPASMEKGWGQIVSGAQARADATANLGKYSLAEAFRGTPATRSAYTAGVEGARRMLAAAQREGLKDCAQTP